MIYDYEFARLTAAAKCMCAHLGQVHAITAKRTAMKRGSLEMFLRRWQWGGAAPEEPAAHTKCGMAEREGYEVALGAASRAPTEGARSGRLTNSAACANVTLVIPRVAHPLVRSPCGGHIPRRPPVQIPASCSCLPAGK